MPSTVSSPSSHTLPEQRWRIAPADPEQAEQIARATSLSPLLAQVLLNRGIETAEQAQAFLNPDIRSLPSPLEDFTDLALSLELLINAINQRHRIAICGDYDADGMTSTALLIRALRSLGGQVEYAIPSRMQEGYGINQRIVEEFYEEGVQLILTVDNGIAAQAPIARAQELGMTVIVTDHHDIPPTLPPANAILNPKLIPETSPYRGLAGVGVAYILAVHLAESLGKPQGLSDSLLQLFTLGTIADMAPLTGVNRRWVRRGLQLLPKSRLAGVQALIQVSGLGGEKNLKPEAIGFRLGPRINAVGRIADPQIVIELLTTDDEGVALERAMQCEDINRERQRLCEQIEQEAIGLNQQTPTLATDDRVLVVLQSGWHHGVIGIVATRLVERYGVPVFICTYEDDTQQHIRGSARSIPEFNVFEALEFSKHCLTKHGGHRAAGGFSLKAENLADWRSCLREFAHSCLETDHLKPLVSIDAQANLEQIDFSLYQQLDWLHPCGVENPDPVFWTPNVQILDQRRMGKKGIRMTIAPEGSSPGTISYRIPAIAWKWQEHLPLPKRLDIAYRLRLNEWQGETTLELELLGIRLPTVEIPSRKAEFYQGDRRYVCRLIEKQPRPELRIRNPEGKILVIQQGEKVGTLGKTPLDTKPVNVCQSPYYELIKAAVNALEQQSAPLSSHENRPTL